MGDGSNHKNPMPMNVGESRTQVQASNDFLGRFRLVAFDFVDEQTRER
jgi:hypothetical protein